MRISDAIKVLDNTDGFMYMGHGIYVLFPVADDAVINNTLSEKATHAINCLRDEHGYAFMSRADYEEFTK